MEENIRHSLLSCLISPVRYNYKFIYRLTAHFRFSNQQTHFYLYDYLYVCFSLRGGFQLLLPNTWSCFSSHRLKRQTRRTLILGPWTFKTELSISVSLGVFFFFLFLGILDKVFTLLFCTDELNTDIRCTPFDSLPITLAPDDQSC